MCVSGLTVPMVSMKDVENGWGPEEWRLVRFCGDNERFSVNTCFNKDEARKVTSL